MVAPPATLDEPNVSPLQPAVQVDSCTKRYAGVTALRDVSIAVKPGEIRALVGQNGAGKSTLIKVVAGAIRPDSGSVRVRGAILGQDIIAHRKSGISVIYQDPQVIPDLSACENVFLGEPPRNRLGLVDDGAMRSGFEKICAELGVDLPANQRARVLSIGDRQLIEIMRALRAANAVLVLDEPTSALPDYERTRLFTVVKRLARSGTAIIYVSHDLEEVLTLCDTITVLRDGSVVHTGSIEEMTVHSLVGLMTGTTIDSIGSPPASRASSHDELVRIAHLSTATGLRNVSLTVRSGEVVGLAGLLGAGRTELLRAIAGDDPSAVGGLHWRSEPARWPKSVRRAKAMGIHMVPEDRRSAGLVADKSATFNISIAHFDKRHLWSWVSDRRDAEQQAEALRWVMFPHGREDGPVRHLSGGNQQKVMLARLLTLQPHLVLLDEPTAGIDVLVSAQIRALVKQLAESGAGVIVAMSDVQELLETCDRLYILNRMQVVAETTPDATTEDEVLRLASGHGGVTRAS